MLPVRYAAQVNNTANFREQAKAAFELVSAGNVSHADPACHLLPLSLRLITYRSCLLVTPGPATTAATTTAAIAGGATLTAVLYCTRAIEYIDVSSVLLAYMLTRKAFCCLSCGHHHATDRHGAARAMPHGLPYGRHV